MHFRQVKNSPVNRKPNTALCIASYLDSVMPKMVWAPLKALLPHRYSASLFSTNSACIADFIIAGVIMMHVFRIWLPILSTRSGIHYFWDNHLCNICFKLVTGSKGVSGQERNWGGRTGRQWLQKPSFFKKLVRKKNLSIPKNIIGCNKSLPVLQSTDTGLMFFGLGYL